MNILYPTGRGAEWYGRNPIFTKVFYSGTGITPHGATLRSQYTVPVARMGVVTYLACQFYRVTAATTVGKVFTSILVSGGSNYGNLCYLAMSNNTPFVPFNINTGCQVWLAGGDTIQLATGDASTGGTVDYFSTAVILEYDP